MSTQDPYLDELAGVIERHGWAVQGVFANDSPAPVDFAYTVGNTAVGLPELLVVGLSPEAAGGLLNAVNRVVRAGTVSAEPGATIAGQLVGLEPRMTLMLGHVAERWAVPYGVLAYEMHLEAGGTPDEVRLLQVVLPDEHGRLWDDPDFDRLGLDLLQPDLSDPRQPWRLPYVPPVDLREAPVGDAAVVLPVLDPGAGDLARREVVPAEGLGDGVFRLVRPPVLADWVTVGTEVRAPEREPVALPATPVVHVFERVERESPLAHLVWLMHVHDVDEYVALVDRIEPDLALPETRWLHTPASVHVATPPLLAARVRSRLRRLVRDGLLVEREPIHRATEPSCGPWCAGHEGP